MHLGLHFLTINPYELYEPMDASLWICVWLMWRFLWVRGPPAVGDVEGCASSHMHFGLSKFCCHFRIPQKISHFGIQSFLITIRISILFWVSILKLCVEKISFPTAGNIPRTSSSHALPPHVAPHPSRQRVHRSGRCQPELFKTVVTFNCTVELIAYDIQWYIWIYKDKQKNIMYKYIYTLKYRVSYIIYPTDSANLSFITYIEVNLFNPQIYQPNGEVKPCHCSWKLPIIFSTDAH